MKYKCNECGWVYDEAKEGKKFSELPSSYKCPKCGVPKSDFSKMNESKDDSMMYKYLMRG